MVKPLELIIGESDELGMHPNTEFLKIHYLSVFWDYSHNEMATGKVLAEQLLQFGYEMVKQSWQPPSTSSSVMGVLENLTAVTPDNFVQGIKRQENRGNTMAFFYPVRLFDGLIDASRHLSYVCFPQVRMQHIVLGWNRDLVNVAKALFGRPITVGVAVKDLNKIYDAQEELLSYEKSLDRKMMDFLRRETKDGAPKKLEDFEVMFSLAFKQAVDNQGGVDRYKQVANQLFDLYEEEFRNGNQNVSVCSRLAHFKALRKRKVQWYESATEYLEMQAAGQEIVTQGSLTIAKNARLFDEFE